MYKFRSLTSKFVFISIIIFSFFLVYTYASFRFTDRIDGEARRINLAGRERMLTFDMTSHMHFIASNGYDADLNRLHRTDIVREMAEYEEILYGLRTGNAKLNLKAISRDDLQSAFQLNKLITLWDEVQKSTLLHVMNLPPEKASETCNQCHAAIRDNFGEVEALIVSLETQYNNELRHFDKFRSAALVFSFAALGFIVLFVRYSIVLPVRRLKDATFKIEKGDFNVRVSSESLDDIGQLSSSANEMAIKLGTLFNEKTKHLNELSVLNRLSSEISKTLSVEEVLSRALDELIKLKQLGTEKRACICLVDEKTKVLRPFVQRGFSKESALLGQAIPYGDCICGITVEAGEMVFPNDYSADDRPGEKLPWLLKEDYVNIPLKSRGKVLGVLCVYLPSKGKPADEETHLLKAAADIIVISLHNALNHRQVAMLAQSLESSNDAITITDLEGKIIHVNPEAVRQFGYGPDDLIGQPIAIIQSGNPPGLGEEIFRKTLEGGWHGEVINVRKDGSEYPALLSTSSVRDTDNNMIALIGIARDITEQKKMETQLKEYAEQLEERVQERTAELEIAKIQAEAANRAKSDFLANMSHELRTPLNAVIGFSQIMREGMTGAVTDEQKEYLGNIYESGTHLLSLINDILDLSKVEAGKMELELSMFDLKSVIERAHVMFKEKAMRSSINFRTEIEEGIGYITADERKIKQVLINLLGNAFKFTPAGGTVTVAVRKLSDAGDFIEISISDTGIGISPEDQEKLFQPFQQIESSLTKTHGGTGLGLHICRQFIRLHEGRIKVESEPERGSKFTFIIPRTSVKKTGEVIEPLTKILTWKHFLTHFKKILAYHENEGKQFGLLRVKYLADNKEDHVSIARILKKNIRKHEIITHSDDNCYYFIVFDTDRQRVDNMARRIYTVLTEKGHENKVTSALYVEDGKALEDLLAKLDS